MPKRKAPEPEPDAFERMARELGCDETGEAFERALARVLPPRRVGETGKGAPGAVQPRAESKRTKGTS
jgi:hypothetical protein